MRAPAFASCVFLLVLAGSAEAATKRPDLAIRSVKATPSASRVAVAGATQNRGKAPAKPSRTAVLLSLDAVRSAGDVQIAAVSVKRLKPRQSASFASNTAIPAIVPAGTYKVIACADAAKRVRERNERNNCRVAAAAVIVGAAGATPTPTLTATPTATPTAMPTPTATATPPQRFTASASAGTGGAVSLSSASANASCAGATCTVDEGSSVTFTATPAAGYRFGGWSGAACAGQPAQFDLSGVSADVTCAATFVETVTVSAVANTGGAVNASGVSGGSCAGTTCTLDKGAGAVTFTPAPDSHYRFGAWSGAGCTGYSSGTGGSITFTNPAAAKACTANWVATVTVAWTAIGAGYGTISVYSSSNATCTPTDSRNGSCVLDSGASQVQLKAQPTGGSVSNGWTGAGCEQWTYPAGGGTLLIVTNPTVDIYCGAGFS